MVEYFKKAKIVPVLMGATASGKTEASVELSKLIPAEAISADSRQIYKYMDVGTAKPSLEERAALPIKLVDFLEPDEYFSAGMFEKMAEQCVFEIFEKNKIPIVVGGGGLYIKALFEGLFEEDEVAKEKSVLIREKLREELETRGADFLYEKLKSVDPKAALEYADKNPRRITRALEYYYATGELFSEAKSKQKKSKIFRPLYLEIRRERKELYERINRRAEKMWENGLPEETSRILKMGYSPDLNSLNAVGYKETIAYLQGKIKEEEAISLIKRNTRRYAKRQITWFKKIENVERLQGNASEIAEKIYERLISEVAANVGKN